MLNSLYIASIILLVVTSVGLGVYSYVRNPKPFVVRLWALTSLAIGLWSIGLMLMLFSASAAAATWYSRLLHAGAAFISILFFHFVLVFLYQASSHKALVRSGYVLAVIFTFLSFWGNGIVAGASPKVGFDYWVDAGRLYPLFLAYFWSYVLLAIYFLASGYRASSGPMKRKVFYILLTVLFVSLSGGSNFLPQTAGVYPVGGFFTWLFPIFITIGIFFDEIRIKF